MELSPCVLAKYCSYSSNEDDGDGGAFVDVDVSVDVDAVLECVEVELDNNGLYFLDHNSFNMCIHALFWATHTKNFAD